MRKFISYVNLYNQKEEKAKNVGFGRMAVEGEKCRLEIQVKNTGLQPQDVPVYLFTRRNDMLLGVKAGMMHVEKGTADFRACIDLEKETQGVLQMREMKGFIMFPKEKEYLASQWDEGRIRRTWFEEWKIPQKNSHKRKETEQEKQEEPAPKDEIPEEVEGKEQDKQRDKEEEKGEDAAHRDKEMEEGDKTQQVERKDVQVQSAQQAMQQPRQCRMWQARENKAEQVEQMQQEKGGEETEWQQLWEAYEVIYPFPQRPETMCVQIQLKDLRMLPKKYWYLGNNNFLLHGFCSYRYLLLGRSENEGSFLGVPGVFQNQERVVAALFGFPHFFQKEAGSCKTGNFGYWIRPIRLEGRIDNEVPNSL